MLVETYEATEVDHEGSPECEEEALALIERLGLEGQREVLSPGDGSRIPYQKMTDEQKYVITKVCPKATKIDAYSDGPIPLRVLQVAAHAQELFAHLVVWHPENADDKDPYLVGVNGDYWHSPRECFLLARWGDELLPWGEMRRKAAAIARAGTAGAAKSIAAKATALAESVGLMSDDEVIEERIKKPTFYE